MPTSLRLLKSNESFSEEGLIEKTHLNKKMKKLLDGAADKIFGRLLDTNSGFAQEHQDYREAYEALLGTSRSDLEKRALKHDHDLFLDKLRYTNRYCCFHGIRDSMAGKRLSTECAEEELLGLETLYRTRQYRKYTREQAESWASLGETLSEPQRILSETYKEKLTDLNYEIWMHMYIAGYEWGVSVTDGETDAYLRRLYKRYGINN